MPRALTTTLLFLLTTAFASAQDKGKDGKAPPPDPKTNNKDKIVGKWKVTEFGGQDKKTKADFEQMSKLGIHVALEFKADGGLVMAVGSDDPKLLDLIKQSAPGQKLVWEAKYKLLAGDTVELYDLSDDLKKMFKGEKAQSEVAIKDDGMKMKDADGTTILLARIKPKGKDKPEKK